MPAGRPREFDEEKALDAALRVFWRKGYDGASMPDLTKAMGINRPSLYAAFGNKESLFRRTMERYAVSASCHLTAAMDEPTARKVVEHFLFGNIDAMTCGKSPRGCFMVQSALVCGDAGTALQKETAKGRAKVEAMLRKRFERAAAEGDLPKSADASELARYVATISNGLAIQASAGATREQLRSVAKIALHAFLPK